MGFYLWMVLEQIGYNEKVTTKTIMRRLGLSRDAAQKRLKRLYQYQWLKRAPINKKTFEYFLSDKAKKYYNEHNYNFKKLIEKSREKTITKIEVFG
jgi:DNA-binding MarR family transcriptional regulator